MLSATRCGFLAVLGLFAALMADAAVAQTANAGCDLCIPAYDGNVGRIQQLLDQGANVGAGDQGFTPLGWALTHDHFDAALLLLDHHADPNITIPYKAQFSPLGYAARAGDVGLVHALIKAGADVNARVGGSTALALAAQVFANAPQPQQASTIRLLLEAGADPNATGLDGRTPLSYLGDAASKASNLDTVLPLIKTLLIHGAEAGQAMRFAEDAGNADMIALLLAYGARITPEDSAAVLNGMRQRPELIPRLIDAGAMVDQVNRDHETALSLAVQEGDIAQVKRLLSLGADPNHQTAVGPPFSQLINKGTPNADMVRVLIEAGEDFGCLFYEPNGQLYVPPATRDDFRKSVTTNLADESNALLYLTISQRYAVLSRMTKYWRPPLSNQDLDPSPNASRHLAYLAGPAPGSITLDEFNRWLQAAGGYLVTANAQAAFFAASKGLTTLPPIPDGARRHEAAGHALYLEAAGPSGALAAAVEYDAAARLAPWIPAYHRNLCVLYQLGGALTRAYEHCAIYASGHPADLARIEKQMREIADRVPYYVFIPKDAG